VISRARLTGAATVTLCSSNVGLDCPRVGGCKGQLEMAESEVSENADRV
jgi:hypothetical protein